MTGYYVVRTSYPNDELYHYGVKGMKWGVRKAGQAIKNAGSNIKANAKKKRVQKADADIRYAEYKKARDKLYYDYLKNDAKIRRMESSKRFARIKDVIYDWKIDEIETKANKDNIRNDWDIARANAKKDKSYKRTEEYKKIRTDATLLMIEDWCDAILYG